MNHFSTSDRRSVVRATLRSRRGRNPTRETLAIAATVLLANAPMLFAFYVTLDTYDTASVGFFRHDHDEWRARLRRALDVVSFAFGPALAGAWKYR